MNPNSIFMMLAVLFGGWGIVSGAAADETSSGAADPQAVVQRTDHSIRIDGERVDYSAYVGWMIQKKDDEPVAASATRPTFARA